jgi:hypothetical protein
VTPGEQTVAPPVPAADESVETVAVEAVEAVVELAVDPA